MCCSVVRGEEVVDSRSADVLALTCRRVSYNYADFGGFQLRVVLSLLCINTLAAELPGSNSTGLRYTTFSIIMQHAYSVYLTAPSVCRYVY